MNASTFTKIFLKRYKPQSQYHPKKIEHWQLTSGYCWYWAYVFCKVFGGRLVNMGNQHMMVKKSGKYYDADHPQGIDEIPTSFGSKVITWNVTYTGWAHAKKDFYMNPEITEIYDEVAEYVKQDLKKLKEK